MERTKLTVAYDFICPWCWIAHRNLEAGKRLADEVPEFDVRYLPFELNPEMPREGMERRIYRTRKFGSWARSEMLDASVTAAGLQAGVTFRYDQIRRTPNTRLAHRLMVHATEAGDPRQVEQLYESIFAAYFAQGRDIGQIETLLQLASDQGYKQSTVEDYLRSNAGEDRLSAARSDCETLGIRSVPTVLIGDFIVSGAQPGAVFAQALQRSLV
jgi:predicted DsbA family dithiol-disulfide isomerase